MSVKVITNNKKAHFDYFLSDFLECGLELKGTEIKSLRFNSANIGDSYIIIKHDEMYVLNMNIPIYVQGNLFNHEPLRTRKLLLHKSEIIKFRKKMDEKGYTIIPTKVYLKDGKAKIEIALAKGKKLYDKREDMKNKSIKRDIERAIKGDKSE
ncbi:MAG: SsrA-binding protein SmpB [Bacilli bacterium]